MRIALLLLLAACGSPTEASEGGAPSRETDGGVAPSIDAAIGETGSDGDTGDASPLGCGEYASATTRFVCAKDGAARGKCVAGAAHVEPCARGCLREASGDDVCMGTTTSFACGGVYGTTKAQNGDYFITSFGCWVDANKNVHTDPGDNCVPGCIAKAQQSVCKSMSGPQCEESVDWYVADSGRFGCMARVRVENPMNGKKVIALVLDAGPACWTENAVQHAILDASGRVNEHLFGAQHGYSDKTVVHVVEVDPTTPLGPI